MTQKPSRFALTFAVTLSVCSVASAAPLPFYDHFETDFSAWTTTKSNGANALTGSTNAAFEGLKAMSVTYAGTSSSAQAAAVVDFQAATTTPAVRFFLYVPAATEAAMGASTSMRILRVGDGVTSGGTGGAAKLNLALRKDAQTPGRLFLALDYVNSSGGSSVAGQPLTTRITAGTWHLVELHYQPLPSRVRLFIDDVKTPRIDLSPNDTPAHTFLTAWLGLADAADAQSNPLTFFIDGAAVATSLTGTNQVTSQHFHEYESGSLLVTQTPPGKAGLLVSNTGYAAGTSANAAHRGGFGLEVTDSSGAAASGAGSYVRTFISPATSTLYRRAFWKVASTNGNGNRTLMTFVSSGLGGAAVAEASVSGAGVVTVGGVNATLSYSSATGTASVTANEWHLLELVATGLGTTSGSRIVYVDGAVMATQTGINWSAVSIDEVTEGHIATTDGTFVGTDQFDDVRTARVYKASKLTILTAGLTDGVCSGAMTIGPRDSTGAARAVAEPTTVALSVTGATGTFYSDSSCTAATTTATVPVGSGAGTFYFKPSSAGPATFLGENVDLLSAPTTVTVASVATKLSFGTTTNSLTAGDCSGAVALQSRAANDAIATVSADVTLSLSSNSTGNTFYSDSGCQTPVASVTLSAGQSLATFYFRDTKAGTPTLTVSSAGRFPVITQGQTISAAAAAKLVFSSSPVTVAAGDCSTALTIQAQDTYGNPSAVAANTSVSFGTTATTTGTFHADGSCMSSGGTLTLNAGSTTANVFYRDTKAAAPSLTASAGGLLNGSQTATVTSAAPTRIVFQTSAQSVGAGQCSAVSTVQLLDQFQNVATAPSNVALGFTSNPATVQFFDTAACGSATTSLTLTAGSSSRNFFFRASSAGTPTLTVAATGLTSASQQQTVTAGTAVKLGFGSAAQTVSAGQCSGALVIQSQDGFGNPTAVSTATTVALTSDSQTLTFHPSGACGAVITDAQINASQSSTTVYFKQTATGPVVLTAAATGFASGTQTQNVNPAPPNQLAFSTPARTVAAGGCSLAITVQSRDGFGNPSNVVSSTSVALQSTSPTGTFHTTSACSGTGVATAAISAGQNQVTFHYRDTRAGTPTLTANNIGLSSVTQQQTVTAGSPAKLAITSAVQTVVAGACSTAATVAVQDNFGNAAPLTADNTLTLSSSSTSTSFHSDAQCGSGGATVALTSGQSTATFYFRDTRAGTAQLTAAATGLSNAVQSATFSAGPASRLVFSSAAQNLVAGQCSAALTVQSVDAAGNLVNVQSDTPLTVSAPSSEGAAFADSACQNPLTQVDIDAGGNAASFFFKATKSGTVSVTVSSASLGNVSQSQTVAAAAPARLSFATGPQTVPAGDCSAASLLALQDAFGNVATSSASIPLTITSSKTTTELFTDNSCGAPLTSLSVPSGGSTASFFWRDTKSGTLTLSAAATGLTGAQQTETISAKPATKLLITSAPRTVAFTTCSPAIVIEARDPNDNAAGPSADVDLQLTSDSATAQLFADAQCATAVTQVRLGAGKTSVPFFFSDSAQGTPTLTASDATLGTVNQQQTVTGAGAAAALAIVPPVGSLSAASCSSAFSVRLLDSAGRAVRTGGAVTVTLSSSSTTAGLSPTSACGTTLTQVTIPVNEYQALFHLKDSRAGTLTLRANAASYTEATLNQVIDCPPVGEGVACDDLDLCNGRETCSAGVCGAGNASSCDDGDSCTTDSCAAATGCAHAPLQQCCSAPVIREQANPNAAVGAPYLLTPFGTASLQGGTGPAQWSTCDSAPLGFSINQTTGLVRWTPQQDGTVPVCLRADGPCGFDEWRFNVIVQPAAPALPVAQLQVPSLISLGAELNVAATGSTGSAPLTHEWSFGDGTMPRLGENAKHTYGRAGAYIVRLTVKDAFGQTATASAPVQVSSPSCATPPIARVNADALTGDGALAVSFSCDCADRPTGSRLLWDFGDGTTSLEDAPTHSFSPGSWPVRLVLSAGDCRSEDATRVIVTDGAKQPPVCEGWAEPVVGPAPLPVEYGARFGDDTSIATGAWTFSDGLSADALRGDARIARTLSAPGSLNAVLEVRDTDGLTCRAVVSAEATNEGGEFSPTIISAPATTARCGAAYQYDADGIAEATGGGIRWSVGRNGSGAPEGFSVEEATGRVSWTPAVQQPGDLRVTLVAKNEAGSVDQDYLVKLECPEGQKACGCGVASVAPLGLIVLALGLRRRRAR